MTDDGPDRSAGGDGAEEGRGHDHDGHDHDGHDHDGHDHDGHDHDGHDHDHERAPDDGSVDACCGGDGCARPGGDGGEQSADGAGTEVEFSVPEMDCSSCASKVDAALADREGVRSTDLRPTTGTARITFDGGRLSRADLVAAIESAGYHVADGEGESDGDAVETEAVWETTRARKTAVSGVFLAFGLLVQFGFAGLNGPVVAAAGRELLLADALYLVAVFAGGQVILRNGYYSAKNRSLDIDFLMSVAIASATGVSLVVPGLHFYVEAASLAFLFNVAELLERYSVDRARSSLEELLTLSPDTATVRRAGATDGDGEPERVEVPVEDVAVGETVLVEPGEKIPMDGTVTEGSSAVDQAPITGESVPVDKEVGDEVFAGTINEQGFLAVETTAAAGDTTIDRIVELVEDAEANKTDREQFVERFADYYTPAVVVAALLATFVAPVALGGGWATWFVRGISLLVIACPCAFVISTPVTVVSGVTSAAKNGVLVKGGDHLEAMGEVDAVAFDKTGTLTTGDLSVTDVVGLDGNDEADVLRCARALERRSEHPIGDAIVAAADERDVEDRAVTDFESITGKGVRADLDGETHYAGKPALFADLGFDLDHVHLTDGPDPVTDGGVAVEAAETPCEHRQDCVDLGETMPRLQSAGKTVVLVGTDEEIEGLVAIADAVRPEARRTVERLREQGVDHLVMLTGDNERTAGAVAEAVGVDDFAADLLPDGKVDRLEQLREEFDTVAMVGDGINDAPALATADVGVAMGAAGTDTALETADVALMGDDLSKLPYLHRLARTGNGIIRQNVWGSLLVKAALAVAIPLPAVTVPLWFVVLAGDVGMTTAVTGNAMRLARLRPDASPA